MCGLKRILLQLKSHWKDYSNFFILIIAGIIICWLALNFFLELSDEVLDKEMKRFDSAISKMVYDIRSDSLNTFMKYITALGDKYAYFILTPLCALVFYFKFNRLKLIIQATIVIVVAGLLNRLLKNFFDRGRPMDMRLIEVSAESYPSGHAMTAIAFYGFLIYISYKYIKDRLLRTVFIVICILIIILVGFSRVYLGVHFPSDVLSGYAAGFIWLLLAILAIEGVNLITHIKKGISNN